MNDHWSANTCFLNNSFTSGGMPDFFAIRGKLWEKESRSGKEMDLNKTSKYLSLILRHKSEVIGITLDRYGWADVELLIKGIQNTQPFSMQMLEDIVSTDNKQRYSFNEDKTKIRANQGHSIPVDVELEKKTPPEYLWHGIGEKYVESIDENGLIPKSRLYVHLSNDYNTAVTGRRNHQRRRR